MGREVQRIRREDWSWRNTQTRGRDAAQGKMKGEMSRVLTFPQGCSWLLFNGCRKQMGVQEEMPHY